MPTWPARPPPDAGFSLVESVLALGLVFAVLTGLLASLPAGLRGAITARQRTEALALAGDVLEQSRGRAYGEVGHDLDSDPTLAADPALAAAGAGFVYTALDPDEELAASSVDAGAAAGSIANPLHPFSPHRWSLMRDGTTYTVSVYVTAVRPAAGDPHKRVTAEVGWDRSLRGPAVPPSIRLSSLVFDADPRPEHHLDGIADAAAGTVTVAGTLGGQAVDARVDLASAHGEIRSRAVRVAAGYAATTRAQAGAGGAAAPGCCAGAKAESSADDQFGAAPGEYGSLGPVADAAGTAAAGSSLAVRVGSATARSTSTARSCWTCDGPGTGDDDREPYQHAEATGPAALSVDFAAPSASGSLVAASAACTDPCAAATLDHDDVAGTHVMAAEAAASYPALDVARLAGAPPGYEGMVRLGPASVRASARAGTGVGTAPATQGNPVTVQLWTGPDLGYRMVAVTPGTPAEEASSAAVPAGAGTVTMTAVVRAGRGASSSSGGGGATTEAEAGLAGWLQVEVHLVTADSDLTILVDYGRVSARATYEPA